MWDIENILLTLEPVLRETVGVKAERFLGREAEISTQHQGPSGCPSQPVWRQGRSLGWRPGPPGPACPSQDFLAAILSVQQGWKTQSHETVLAPHACSPLAVHLAAPKPWERQGETHKCGDGEEQEGNIVPVGSKSLAVV